MNDQAKTSFNDFRDAMAIYLDDMSDLYNHVFMLAFYEGKLPEEIAIATGRPLFFIHSIIAHFAELETFVQNDLDDAGLGGTKPNWRNHDFYKKLYFMKLKEKNNAD